MSDNQTSHRPSTILICDDAPVDRLLIRRLLESSGNGYEILEATDGSQALRSLATNPVDLVVTDLAMPNTDGLQLVRQIKEHWPHLPVVLVTGVGSEQSALQALVAGAASYSPKSILSRDLCRTVQFVLEIAAHSTRGGDGESAAKESAAVSSPVAAHILDNDCRMIGPVIENLQQQLPQWSESERLQIGMALGEALTNAMHHGNLEVSSTLRRDDDAKYYQQIRQRREELPFAARRVRVTTVFGADEICIRICDEGPGFDLSTVADPREPENLTEVSGRGLLLIRSFMDKVRYHGSGNEIEMVKRRIQDPRD